MDAVTSFRDAMARAGLETRDGIIPDGELHRFHVESDRHGSRNGWYVLHLDGVPAGSFGSWKTGETRTWRAKSQGILTPAEQAAFKARMKEAGRQRQKARAQSHDSAKERAAFIWSKALPADVHPYLSRKGVKAFGIRQHKGCLVIPLRDTSGVIHSLQFIDTEGNKRFLSGGAIAGHYFAIGRYSDTLCIAEGFATGASIHQATGHAVAVAFNAGNLKPVALALRGKFPEAKIILCADNDRFTPGNPGLTQAREAALTVRGRLYVPRFDDLGPHDYYQREGNQ